MRTEFQRRFWTSCERKTPKSKTSNRLGKMSHRMKENQGNKERKMSCGNTKTDGEDDPLTDEMSYKDDDLLLVHIHLALWLYLCLHYSRLTCSFSFLSISCLVFLRWATSSSVLPPNVSSSSSWVRDATFSSFSSSSRRTACNSIGV
jgi:hypothetical protein